jgi:hypothetical protein
MLFVQPGLNVNVTVFGQAANSSAAANTPSVVRLSALRMVRDACMEIAPRSASKTINGSASDEDNPSWGDGRGFDLER